MVHGGAQSPLIEDGRRDRVVDTVVQDGCARELMKNAETQSSTTVTQAQSWFSTMESYRQTRVVRRDETKGAALYSFIGFC